MSLKGMKVLSAAVLVGAMGIGLVAQASGVTNETLLADLATIDSQLSTLATNIAALNLTNATIITAANQTTTVTSSMTALVAELQGPIADAQAAGNPVPSQATLDDLNTQIANANALAATARAQTASGSPRAKLYAGNLLRTAQNDLIAARADLGSIYQTLGIQ